MANVLRVPVLSRGRIVLAFTVAVMVDFIQLALGPLGWTFIDEVLDVLAMIVLSVALGFHPVFLPTFILEFVPVIDALPFWTGCVALVTALRRRQQRSGKPPPSTAPASNAIDV